MFSESTWNSYLQEEAQEKQKREQLEHLWKDMGSVRVQGSTLAGTSPGRLSSLQKFSEEFALRSASLFPQQKCESSSMLEERGFSSCGIGHAWLFLC